MVINDLNLEGVATLPQISGTKTKKAQVIDSLELFELVAGAGFEPTTFGL